MTTYRQRVIGADARTALPFVPDGRRGCTVRNRGKITLVKQIQ
jgi:hypothetical protein